MKSSVKFFLVALAIFTSDLLPQNKNVTIDQRLSTGQQTGVLKKWEVSNWSNPFNPGTVFSFPINSNQVILGDQTIQSNQKYNNWNLNYSNVKNHQSHTITNETAELRSNFIPTHTGITIKTSLEGTTATGGFLEFKDPWFIDYQDVLYANQLRNRGMTEAYPRQRTSPFYPNATTQYENEQTYRGVFKDQFFTSGTFYKVNIPLEQTITVHGQNRKFYFENWEASIINNQPSAQFQDGYLQETGVVFKDPNAVVKAKLKGQLMSNTTSGISSTSQRKIVRTDNGKYHIVYESNGSVYYTYSLSSDFNGNWQKDDRLEDDAKNPSMDYYGNIVSIVYEYLDGPAVKIRYVEIDATNGNVSYHTDFDISSNANDFGIVKPVVSSIYFQRLIVYKESQNSNLKYRIRSYTQTWHWNSGPKNIPETDQNSINPAIVGNKNLSEHHIVYQQGTSTIKYKHADSDGLEELRFCQYRDVSENSGFSTNQNPSVSVSYNSPNHKVQVSWQGIYIAALEKAIAKEQDYFLKRFQAVTRLKVGEDSWGTNRNFGANVKYVQSGSLNSTNGAIITWSETNGNYTKYVKRRTDTNYDPTASLSTNGLYALVSNGSTFENLKASVFNTLTSAPYLISNCTNDFSIELLDKLNSSGSIDLTYGRAGVIGKNGIEFLFSIGDVLLNNESIKFIEKNDTLPITSVSQLNEAARTNNFYINSQSELMFSNFYYVVNKTLADSLLTNEFNLNFKCELVNASTNNVVGTFDNVTYNKFNVQEYANPSYLIDCNGIEADNYYLRLFSVVNEDVEFALSEIQRDNVTLEKQNFILRNFRGAISPMDFTLEQNYPNPFNPSTTIRYQIPQDGIVTLKIYDILGSEVATLVNEEKVAGKYEVNFNAIALASGVYIYKIQSGSFVNSKKMILIK